jgi:hypothetical protein
VGAVLFEFGVLFMCLCLVANKNIMLVCCCSWDASFFRWSGISAEGSSSWGGCQVISSAFVVRQVQKLSAGVWCAFICEFGVSLLWM